MMQPVWTKHQELWAARLTYSGLIMFQRAGSVVHLSLLSQCHVTLGNPQRQPPHSSAPPDQILCLCQRALWPLFDLSSSCMITLMLVYNSTVFFQRPARPCRNPANVGTRSVLMTRSPRAPSPPSHKQSRPTRRAQVQLQQPFSLLGASPLHLGQTQSSLNVCSTCTEMGNTFIWVTLNKIINFFLSC